MLVFRKVSEFCEFINSQTQKIGLVPTMGALHEGHKSLIQKCISENEVSIVSIFVNPKQFLKGEDLEKYPKNDEKDIEICENLGVSAVFLPKSDEIYFDDEPSIKAPEKFANVLEGKTRPGHFDGVLCVLNKLFRLANPNNVYFGKKDTQQLLIVQNMVKTFFMNINVVSCDIVRANDGLALSSRNSYLNDDELCQALKISRSLNKASTLINNGELDANDIKSQMLSVLEPLKIDYVEITNRNLEPVSKVELGKTLILVAVYVGQTRLIDNIWV